MRVDIHGHHLPGRMFACADGAYENVHVAVQHGRDPAGLVPGDAASASWTIDVRVVDGDDGVDFRGPAVHGKRGERFVYLTWGEVGGDDSFTMFRRAKLMLGDIDVGLLAPARHDGSSLVARVDLTDDKGGPRCARVRPPAIEWSVVVDRDHEGC